MMGTKWGRSPLDVAVWTILAGKKIYDKSINKNIILKIKVKIQSVVYIIYIYYKS